METEIINALRACGHTNIKVETDYGFYCAVMIELDGSCHAIMFAPTLTPSISAIVSMLGPYANRAMG